MLFHNISEEGPLRTTPTQSPRTSRHLGSYRRGPQPSSTKPRPDSRSDGQSLNPSKHKERKQAAKQHQVSHAQTTPGPELRRQRKSDTVSSSTDSLRDRTIAEDDGDDRTPTATPPPTARRCEAPTRYYSEQGMPDINSRHDMLRTDSESIPVGSIESPGEAESVTSEDTVKGDRESSAKTGRKRATFYASTPANRRRPVAMRRKSSQSSSSTASSTASPRRSVASINEPKISESTNERRASARSSSGGQPNHLSQQEQTSGNAGQTPAEMSTARSSALGHEPGQHQPGKVLVDPDFRSKFVAKTRSAQSSFTSLPSLLRAPNSTTAASASFQASGTMGSGHQAQPAVRVKNTVTFSDEVPPLTNSDLADPNVEHEGVAQALPRTRSQLTMLLEKNRRHTGGDRKGNKHQKQPSG